ncbi:hypothetical protein AVBRAN_1281 [Campylobacter sp. RM12651]|nr:hypothetical protein AVBRAN_1281 [Campylobacter sp. RM12651]
MENLLIFTPHIIGVSCAVGFVLFAKYSKMKEDQKQK